MFVSWINTGATNVVGYCFKLVNSKILIKVNSLYVMFQNVMWEMDPQYTSEFDIAYWKLYIFCV